MDACGACHRRSSIGYRITMGCPPPAGNLVFLLLSCMSIWGCAPVETVRTYPTVVFAEPRGAKMFLTREGRTLRVRFDGKARVFPLVCSARRWLVRTDGPAESVKYTMERFSARQGFLTARLYSSSGRFIAEGRICVFPTFKTPDKEILERYVISIPVKKLARRPKGRSAVLFQTYANGMGADPALKHVAWVFYIAPQ